jgi:nickel/cobalt exporter
VIDTGHGLLEIAIFETGVPPRFRLHAYQSAWVRDTALFNGAEISIETIRNDGAKQTFTFSREDGYLESREEIPEPHEFEIVTTVRHGDHSHVYKTRLTEEEHAHHHHHAEVEAGHEHHQHSEHQHGHNHAHSHGTHLHDGEYKDAHEQAHAMEIASRFSSGTVTNGQLVLFGLTGGLMPCPAALPILLLCLQLKRFALGLSLVACFSIGLAVTLVATGSLAAWGVRHASKRIKGFDNLARRLPYISTALLVVLGVYLSIQGWSHLHS